MKIGRVALNGGVAEGFRAYTDVWEVFRIAVPEATELLMREEALFPSHDSLQFSSLVLDGERLLVKLSCVRLSEWHRHITYKDLHTKEEYAWDAAMMYETRTKKYFAERAASLVQWDKHALKGPVKGGVNCIRLATWWGDPPVMPHAYTCFAAVSEHWIVLGSIEEEVPVHTGDILESFGFLLDPQLAGAGARKAEGGAGAGNWD